LATKVFLISHSDCNPAGDFGALDEKKLLSSAKSGKGLAFDDLCKNHRKKILQTTYRITRNREDAEDALQDSLLRAFLHIQEFDGRSSFATWLTRIAINSSLMILRKKRATRQVWVENPAEVFGKVRNEQTDHRSVNPELLYARGEEGEILRGAIRDLRPSIRQVLELQQLQENSIKDTAKILGISPGTAKARLFHARIALRTSVRKRLVGRNRADLPGPCFQKDASEYGLDRLKKTA